MVRILQLNLLNFFHAATDIRVRNFIYDEKYEEKDPKKYQALTQQGAEKGARQKLKDTYHHYFDGLTGRGQETEQNQNGEDQKKGAQQMQLTRRYVNSIRRASCPPITVSSCLH